MRYYRLYSLNGTNTHIIDVQDFRADGDASAIVKVGAPVVGVTRELWNHGRKVMVSCCEPALDSASQKSKDLANLEV